MARRREVERERREALYRKLVDAILDMSSGNAAPLVVESQQAWIYASDEVLIALNAYLAYYLSRVRVKGEAIPDDERKRIQWFDAKIRLAIRRDLRSTKITEEWIETAWVAVAASPDGIEKYRSRSGEKTDENHGDI